MEEVQEFHYIYIEEKSGVQCGVKAGEYRVVFSWGGLVFAEKWCF